MYRDFKPKKIDSYTITALICPVNMKFVMLLNYVLSTFVFEFHKNLMVIVTSFTCSQINCLYLKCY